MPVEVAQRRKKTGLWVGLSSERVGSSSLVSSGLLCGFRLGPDQGGRGVTKGKVYAPPALSNLPPNVYTCQCQRQWPAAYPSNPSHSIIASWRGAHLT
jgi:hypothetical protein